MEECKNTFEPFCEEFKEKAMDMTDLKQMAVDMLSEDLELMVNLFQRIAKDELRFVERTSKMAFMIGLVQIALYASLNQAAAACHWLHGWLHHQHARNQMIFSRPTRNVILGGYVNIQGVFLKRQLEVSEELSILVCNQLLNATRMCTYIFNSPSAAKIIALLDKHVEGAVLRAGGGFITKEHIDRVVGTERHARMKDALDSMFARIPTHRVALEKWLDRIFDLENTMRTRLQALPADFAIFHPVFEQDEWMVDLLGGSLGFSVGLFQMGLFFINIDKWIG